MIRSISVLGCGWLGLPLAEFLISKGFLVKGSTTTPGKKDILFSKNIDPFLIELNPAIHGNNLHNFFDCEILIINIPPGRVDNKVDYHKRQIESVLEEVKNSPVSKIIFISSTSVYKNENREVTESDQIQPETESGKALQSAEELIFNNRQFDKTIIRFAGLIDNDRNPVKYFAGAKNIPGAGSPVNLIHIKDCIDIIYSIIIRDIWNEIFNACSDLHPSKKEFYSAAALKYNLTPPEFNDTNENYKIVISEKMKRMLDYNFIYPDPLLMI
jgi:nucleoside-diphosphate-sugar epimerase